jgi:Holliday junction resolvase RusA-like endonuclease
LMYEAVRILIKYNYELPIISDNKGNENLKIAFKQLGLDRNVRITSKINQLVKDEVKPLYSVISWHKSRKTAITTAIKKGIPIELVMQLSGHSQYKTMKRYIDNAKNELKDAMNSKMSKNKHLKVEIGNTKAS